MDEVLKSAKKQAKKNDAYRYRKQPTPARIGPGVRTNPAQVLHELGTATTLLDASPLAQVAPPLGPRPILRHAELNATRIQPEGRVQPRGGPN
ncbi:hypothetical protein [Salinispora pacifica]|uniref:hypothetical protein n=1 Tax=Salinispora pacifica TaxID=351187 RepID=UPI000480FFB4|nr:hypothetical protein [Salinispora pacifica]